MSTRIESYIALALGAVVGLGLALAFLALAFLVVV